MHDLVEAAQQAREKAYAPYSEFNVGAALETSSGDVFMGCNIENANYSNTLHAEEVSIANAVSSGHREFRRLAIASQTGAPPCGMCRQSLTEFDDGSLQIILTDGEAVREFTLRDLLPESFEGEMIKPDPSYVSTNKSLDDVFNRD